MATAAAPGADEPELFDPRSMAANMKAVSYVRTIMTIVGGFAAGIFGITGLKGFVFFAAVYVATSALILVRMNDNLKVTKYVPKTDTISFLYSGIVGEALAFVLYWTLSYALVHIY